jgi:hypothetical protein
LLKRVFKLPRWEFISGKEAEREEELQRVRIDTRIEVARGIAPDRRHAHGYPLRLLTTSMNAYAKTKEVSAKPFVYSHAGAMAYIGQWNAITELSKDRRFSGWVAWLMWRSAYFGMTVSWRNKFLIPTHW